MGNLIEKLKKMLNVKDLDEETTKMTEGIVILRVATKHINLWLRQLEMKRSEICELAGLMDLEGVKNEIETEKASRLGRENAPITSQEK